MRGFPSTPRQPVYLERGIAKSRFGNRPGWSFSSHRARRGILKDRTPRRDARSVSITHARPMAVQGGRLTSQPGRGAKGQAGRSIQRKAARGEEKRGGERRCRWEVVIVPEGITLVAVGPLGSLNRRLYGSVCALLLQSARLFSSFCVHAVSYKEYMSEKAAAL